MAKKKKTAKWTRRTPEERIKDLQAEIERIQSRAKAKELKTSNAHKLAMTAVRNLDKAATEARAESNNPLVHAILAAREPIAEYLQKQGVELPKPRKPRGPRPKS
jgi:hypothetical protein